MCIVFSIIERVYWYLMVILSSIFVDECSYVSFPRSFFFFVFSLSHILLEREMSDLLLGALGYCLFHHYIHYWCDFTPCLNWVDHHFSSCIHCFTIILVIVCDSSYSLHLLVLFLHWPIPGLIFPLHHSCVSHYQFDLLHCLIVDIIFTLGTFRSMAHEFFYTCCILYMRL